jgi:hypothetical protein
MLEKILSPAWCKNSDGYHLSIVVPLTLLYGSECWTTKNKDKTSSTAAEMNFVRQMAKYTWMDHKQHDYILQE